MCVEPQVGREVLITLLVWWNKSQSAPNIQTLSDPVKEERKRKIYTCMNVPKGWMWNGNDGPACFGSIYVALRTHSRSPLETHRLETHRLETHTLETHPLETHPLKHTPWNTLLSCLLHFEVVPILWGQELVHKFKSK